MIVQNIISIDGVKTKFEHADWDGDGKVGGIETVSERKEEVLRPKESSELGDVLDKAFEDKLSPDTKTSSMDMLANIQELEEKNAFVMTSLVSMRFLTKNCLVVIRQLLRLSISRDARGRNDIRDISIGKREQDKLTAGAKASNFMGNAPQV